MTTLLGRTFIRTMSAVKASKSLLRNEIQDKLAALSSEEKKRQSREVFEKLIQLKEYKEAKRISVYLSTDNEIDTDSIVRNIFESGKLCFVPRYHGKVMEMVKLISVEDWKNLPLTKWNIKQPSVKEDREDALKTGGLDLIILPGVAFTKDGNRLGHGMGYYDKFLWKVKDSQKTMPFTTALAFKEQIVENLPLEDSDFKLDAILYAS